jgi:hypothetical protein
MGFLMDFVILMKPLPHNLCKPFVLYLEPIVMRSFTMLLCDSAHHFPDPQRREELVTENLLGLS